MSEAETICAEVFRADRLECLLVVPKRSADSQEVLALLRDALPGVPFTRTARGIPLRGTAAERVYKSDIRHRFTWTLPAVQFIENRAKAPEAHARGLEVIAALRSEGRAAAERMLGKNDRLNCLDGHQLVNVAAMAMEGGLGLCLFDEQGAGKTISGIFAFDELVRRDQVDFALIVAPKSMVGEWPKDFQRFTGDLYRVVTASGSLAEKRKALHGRPDVLVTNFESAVSMEKELDALLRSYGGRSIIIVDESFFIKSPTAQRTLALRRLREWVGRGFVLCGTPAPNSASDLIEQFNFVDFGTTFHGMDIPDDREEALPVVQAVVDAKGLYMRHLKADVLPDLPSKSFQRVLVTLQPRQAELYHAALKSLADDLSAVSEIEFKRNITNFLSRRSTLLQICSNPANVSDSYDELPAKILALDGILDKYITGQGEKVVLWSFYTAMIDALVVRYAKHGVLRYDGKVADVAERREAVRKFQEDDTAMLFVANPAAAGAGLTLHRARVAIYESMSNQAAHYLQSLDRIHRRGQARAVDYIVLLCEGTLELDEYDTLLRKEASAQALLGDSVTTPPTRTTMLQEALRLLELARKAI